MDDPPRSPRTPPRPFLAVPYRPDPTTPSQPLPTSPTPHLDAALREVDRIFAEFQARRRAGRGPPRVY